MPASPSLSPTPHAPKPLHGWRLTWLGQRLIAVGLFLAAGALFIFSLGLAQRLGWIRAEPGTSAAAPAAAAADFTCPMHPQIRQPLPGRCPICGMELVPSVGPQALDLDEFSVRIEPAQRRLANIQTAKVERGPIAVTLQTVGALAVDESRQATIAAYVAGRLERLFADYTGVEIKAGDHLAVIYSPQLYAAQVEYLEARRGLSNASLPAVRQAQEALAANTRQRLSELGMTDAQIADLERDRQPQSRLTIYAPQGGTVVEKLAVEGSYVQAGDPIYRIAELSTVWLMLELFPEDAARVRFGQRVEAVVQSLPGETLVGRVAFISPTVSATTRTVGVRVELLNEHRRLRPGDYASAKIQLPIGEQGQVYDQDLAGKWISPMHPQIIRDEPGPCPICGMDLVPTAQYGFAAEPVPQPESLYVPRSAVLLAGEHSVVYVETEPGRFEIRPVRVGTILTDKVLILAGLAAGEEVATAGNFLIDSQMQLAGKPSLIDPSRALARSEAAADTIAFAAAAAIPVAGAAGEKLESLFAAYTEIQAALAADQLPPAPAVAAIHQTAAELQGNADLPQMQGARIQNIVGHTEHLVHVDLAGARQLFMRLSAEILPLAAAVRGAHSQATFTQFHCPMVPGGGGDWLQLTDALRNPYFGSRMLTCGEKVRELPPAETPGPAAAPLPPTGTPPLESEAVPPDAKEE